METSTSQSSDPHVVVPEWMTSAQVQAISQLYHRCPSNSPNQAHFFTRVHPILAGNGAVGVTVDGVFYGIEPDGYTHT